MQQYYIVIRTGNKKPYSLISIPSGVVSQSLNGIAFFRFRQSVSISNAIIPCSDANLNAFKHAVVSACKKKTLSGKWLPCLGISWISDANIIGQQEVPV
jgi:hypothetical protein